MSILSCAACWAIKGPNFNGWQVVQFKFHFNFILFLFDQVITSHIILLNWSYLFRWMMLLLLRSSPIQSYLAVDLHLFLIIGILHFHEQYVLILSFGSKESHLLLIWIGMYHVLDGFKCSNNYWIKEKTDNSVYCHEYNRINLFFCEICCIFIYSVLYKCISSLIFSFSTLHIRSIDNGVPVGNQLRYVICMILCYMYFCNNLV